jgi:polysaccharide biosynthesis/export protein
MMHKRFRAGLVAAALLFQVADRGIAQMGLQQMSGPSTQSQPRSDSGSQSRNEAAAVARSSGLMVVPQDFANLRLAPGFLLSLNVLDDPDFMGAFRIDQAGDIAVPVLGTLHVGGETASEARVQIRQKLLDGQILKDPQVTLTVLEYTAPLVTILGEVTNPGTYPMLAPRKLVDVLALAGGTTLVAGNEVEITRGSGQGEPVVIHYSRATDAKVVEGVTVSPGDTVRVKRAGIVYVLGAVFHPGGYVMQEEGTLNVLQAIPMAGGTALAAKTGTIYLLRKNMDGTVLYISLPYDKMTHGQSANVHLKAQDILYVPSSRIKTILTQGQGIIAAAGSASIYAAAVY